MGGAGRLEKGNGRYVLSGEELKIKVRKNKFDISNYHFDVINSKIH